MSQPEVRFVAPRPACGAAGVATAAVCPPGQSGVSSKFCSFLNLNINRHKVCGSGGFGGVPQPVTTTVPAFATATIPIAFQTTQFTTTAQSALLGTQQNAALSQTEAAELIRGLIRREAARLDNGRSESVETESAPRSASCDDLKARVERIEERVTQIEKKVDGIAAKLAKLP